MKQVKRILSSLAAVVLVLSLFSFVACTPGVPEVAEATVSILPSATPSAQPTPSPEPTPKPLTFEVNKQLKSIADAGIWLRAVEYIKNQSISFVLSINHPNPTLYLDLPCYATVNGWGLICYSKDKNDQQFSFDQGSINEITLVAELDETLDKLLNISQIRDVTVQLPFIVPIGFTAEIQNIVSEVFYNPDCPSDYVQPYPQFSEHPILASESGINVYRDAELNNYFYIVNTILDEKTQKLYVTLYGNPVNKVAIPALADFGNAYLAVDGLITDFGSSVFLPNGGYTVLTFDVSKHKDFSLTGNRCAVSFFVSYSESYWAAGYLSADLSVDAQDSQQPSYDETGTVWASTAQYELIYQGISTINLPYNLRINSTQELPCLDFLFINRSATETLALRLDKVLLDNEKTYPVWYEDLPVPPLSAGIVHLPFADFLHKKSLNEGLFDISFKVIKPSVIVDKIQNTIEPTN